MNIYSISDTFRIKMTKFCFLEDKMGKKEYFFQTYLKI